MFEYYELIDGLGQDYYRLDSDGNIERWDSEKHAWFDSKLQQVDLDAFSSSPYTLSFTEVTEDDVR